MPQCAACARCNKEDCSAVVIIPAVTEKSKKFSHQEQCLYINCPSCHREFSVPLRNVEYLDVTDEQLSQGYMRGLAHAIQ